MNYKIISHELLKQEEVNSITIEEIRNYLRVKHEDDDNILKSLLMSSLEMAEKFLRFNLIVKNFKIKITGRLPKILNLPENPVIKIININDDFRGYYLSSCKSKIIFTSQILENDSEIIYQSGCEKIPHSIKEGILRNISLLYDGNQNCEFNIAKDILPLFSLYKKMEL